jgi:phosphotransferase system enzyme I (PtsI)
VVDELHGNPASPGAAAGPVARLTPAPVLPEHWDEPGEPAVELALATEALTATVTELEKRAASVSGEVIAGSACAIRACSGRNSRRSAWPRPSTRPTSR